MCTYPIGLVIGLVFRLGLAIFISSYQLNVSPIASRSTFFSIATTSHTDTETQRHTGIQSTQKTPSRLHLHVQTHRLNFTPRTNYPFQHVVRKEQKTRLTRRHCQDQELHPVNHTNPWTNRRHRLSPHPANYTTNPRTIHRRQLLLDLWLTLSR